MTEQLIKTIDQGTKAAGNRQISRNGQVANGVYIYRLQAGSFSSTKKMMIVK